MMTKIQILTALIILINGTAFAQSPPEAINYQAIARDASGDPMASTDIAIQFRFHQGSAGGTVAYSETHFPTTSPEGLFELEIGRGTPDLGLFADLNWGGYSQFLEVRLDPSGVGINFFTMGTQELLSVPYALHAGDDGDWVLGPSGLHNNGYNVGINTTTPAASLDVNGSMKYSNGNESDGLVLTSDANGNASWSTLSAESVFGSGTVPIDHSCLFSVAELPLGESPTKVVVDGDHAYLIKYNSSSSQDFLVIDIADPLAPTILSTTIFPDQVRDIAVEGGYAYLSVDESNGLMVLDISDPLDPVVIGSLEVGPFPYAIAVQGSYVYLADVTDSDLKVIDISDPTNPVLVGGLGGLNFGGALAFYENYIVLLSRTYDDLHIIDISDPTTPVLAGSFQHSSTTLNDFLIAGSNAYVITSADRKLLTVDLTDPLVPSLTSTLELGATSESITMINEMLYITGSDNAILLGVDVTIPEAPVLVTTFLDVDLPISIANDGRYLYLCDYGYNDLKVLDPNCLQVAGFNPADGSFSITSGYWISSGGNIVNTNGGDVGIGTVPEAMLHVAQDAIIHGITVGKGGVSNFPDDTTSTAIGYKAMFSDFIGYSGPHNTALGSHALSDNSFGSYNTATGSNALTGNLVGWGNTANGSSALANNQTGDDNTAIGTNALFSNSSRSYMTAVGSSALYSNTDGQANTAVGNNAFRLNTIGSNGTAMGDSALFANVDGDENTAVGSHAMFNNSSGSRNSAFGFEALQNNAAGDENTALGHHALFLNSYGVRNTANGHQSMDANTLGSWNSAYGSRSMLNNSGGSYNTAMGYEALYLNETGNYRCALGYGAGTLGADYNNSMGLGYNADPTAANTIHIGDGAITSIKGAVGFTTYSDERFKKNFRTDEVIGLEFITKLTPLTYNYDTRAYAAWKEATYGEKDVGDWESKYDIENIRFSGFSAQEVERVAKDIGYDFSGVDAPKNDKDTYGLRYAEFVVPLVKAVQELSEQLDIKNGQIEDLLSQIEANTVMLNELNSLLNAQTQK